jgi:PspAA-like protein
VIVRLMGEGQFRVADSDVDELNGIDNAAAAAVEVGDEAGFRLRLEELHEKVREVGEPLELSDLSSSDLIVPPVDLSLDEARELFSGDGLIPDLPA